MHMSQKSEQGNIKNAKVPQIVITICILCLLLLNCKHHRNYSGSSCMVFPSSIMTYFFAPSYNFCVTEIVFELSS